ncbi:MULTISPECIES: helix-turn-helix transcriptional regulator [unclassified Streptomyces]|uniref:helix-turn-helix domain-containing protein n=1 Tax=unclassified Streptomyces TaxID=2593676 RepID=UPI000886D895|nr:MULTISPECIES: helix-turn-helix transcriptional regulator [unclassified Streptomyces]PBC84824.1 helix-turn-helix protein [Streptomyces sp. 2321.6]SDR26093.1 Helix-turn-helix domain-containing protein [Streptomyces sp. KS_16]SED45884.1 Helix-turn-helix domain-containing protein [Streptomyces sp. 2133.1]SNC70847.1 Helix-turn-helix domain-containing protein [Streptomyces sp. 2114.4]
MTFAPEQLEQSTQRLAAKLKELRKTAGLSGDRLAARCNISQSKVSRIENAKVRPSLVDIEQILKALDASPEVVAEVAQLARIAHTEWRNLRELRRKGLGTRQAELKALESSCTHMRYFLLSMITGLLATPAYARASLANSPVDTSKAVAGKLERQAILYDQSKRFTFLLTEQAVRWPVVPPLALAEQMDRLASLTHLPNIRIGVIPVGTPTETTPLNTFTIYDSSLATVETMTGSLVLRDGRDIKSYLNDFTHYEKCALFGDQVREKLADWAAVCRS